MEKMTAIVVGLGAQSLNDHIPALLQREDVRIVGVCDPSPGARSRFRKVHNKLSQAIVVSDNIHELLGQLKPKIAVVAVPHEKYYEIVKELCARKVYFLKEKPLARNVSEAEKILAIPGFGKYGFITTQRRYGDIYQQAKLHLEKLGDLYLFHAVYKLNVDSPDEGWRGSKTSAGGGCLIDMGYHTVDQLLWWFGMPEKVHAQISTLAVPDSDYDAEDSATISFQYANGLHGALLISRAAGEKREEYEIYGSKGYLVGTKKQFTVYDRGGKIIEQAEQDDASNMLDTQLDFFMSRARLNEGFVDVQKEHMLNMQFIERCYNDAESLPYRKKANKIIETNREPVLSSRTE